MTAREWWDSAPKPERERVAQECGIRLAYLYQIVIRFRQPSPALARKLEAASAAAMTAAALRPDIFGEAA